MTEFAPGRSGTLHVNGVRLVYLDYGPAQAPLVVCLHGFPDSPASFRHLAADLVAAGYRVVTPWLRGYPPSEVVDGPYQVAALARDAIALATALSPSRPAFLVGHDWGGLATYGAAVLEPSRWHGVAVLSVPPTKVFRPFLEHDWEQQRASWYQFLFQLEEVSERVVSAEGFGFLDRLWRSWSPGWQADPDVVEAARISIRAGFPASLRYYRDAWQRVRQDPGLVDDQRRIVEGPIKVCALVLYGLQDGCILPGAFANVGEYFAGPHIVDGIAGVGHFLHLETPSVVSERIVSFLTTATSRQATVRNVPATRNEFAR